jgi:cell division protein FtsL
MDASGFALFPFCCTGVFFSAFVTIVVNGILSRIKKLSDDEKSFLVFITFAITLAIAYFIVSNMFKDLYVM